MILLKRGECRRRQRKEMYQLCRLSDLMTLIRISRLRWAGHVERMSDEDILKGIMDRKAEGRRINRRSKLRWINVVLEDTKKVGVKGW